MHSLTIAALVAVLAQAQAVEHHSAPPYATLAMIHVETKGDACAHREGSQYYGLLQMGRLAGVDAGMTDYGHKTTTSLHCDIDASVQMFYAYMERYESRHAWQPMHMAVLWKGGPGAAGSVWRRIHEGWTFDRAVVHAEREHGIPGLTTYLDRYRNALVAYKPHMEVAYVR